MQISKSDILNVNDLVEKLEEFRKEIISIDYIHNKKKFFNIIRNFRRYLVLIESKNEKLYDTFLHSKYYKFYQDFFTNTNMYYLRTLESVQSVSIMTKGIHNFRSFSELLDKEIIRESFERKDKEIESIDFSNAKTLIAVGSGPLPETLLYIYENTNIENIIGIDNNHEAVFMSGEMINGLNLDKITFHQGDGVNYDYKDADIIYLPLFTYPKDKILDRIVETGKDSVQILLCNPKGLGNLLFKGVNSINSRLKITYRNDAFSLSTAQEVIKLEKYDF